MKKKDSNYTNSLKRFDHSDKPEKSEEKAAKRRKVYISIVGGYQQEPAETSTVL